MLDKIRTRSAKGEDLGFVLSSWLKSYKTFSETAKRIRSDIFYKHHEIVLKNLLNKESIWTCVAHLEDDEDVIVGYAVFETDTKADTLKYIIHFVYVKSDWRGQGIANKLLTGIDVNECVFTHWTYPMDSYTQKHKGLVYNPYRV